MLIRAYSTIPVNGLRMTSGDGDISKRRKNDDEQLRRLLAAVPVIVGLIAAAVAIVEGPAGAVGLLGGAAVARAIPPLRRSVLRREPDLRAGAIFLVVVLAGGGVGLLIHRLEGPATDHSPLPNLKATGYKNGKWYEQEGTRPVEVFGTPGSSSTVIEPPIKPFKIVQVTCRIHVEGIPTAHPEGNWYRIATPPWRNRGYAPTNAFWNGSNVVKGPGVRYTDLHVPTCQSQR